MKAFLSPIFIFLGLNLDILGAYFVAHCIVQYIAHLSLIFIPQSGMNRQNLHFRFDRFNNFRHCQICSRLVIARILKNSKLTRYVPMNTFSETNAVSEVCKFKHDAT